VDYGSIGTLIRYRIGIFWWIRSESLEFRMTLCQTPQWIHHNCQEWIAMWIFGTLPLKLCRNIRLTQETMTMNPHIEWVGVIPSHKLFFAGSFERFAQGNHVVDHVAVIGNDACFEPFDGEGEDIGYHECLGGVGIGST